VNGAAPTKTAPSTKNTAPFWPLRARRRRERSRADENRDVDEKYVPARSASALFISRTADISSLLTEHLPDAPSRLAHLIENQARRFFHPLVRPLP
jgi:hypothetical protein